MGHGHATMGAAAWVALTATGSGALGLVPMEPQEVIAGALITAGFALWPDSDHHSGTIAHSLPPLSNLLTRGVGAISGGHRQATHSLLGIAVTVVLALALALLRVDVPGHPDFQLGAWLLVLLPVAFAARALRLTRDWLSAWAVAAGVATGAIWFAPESLWWLPLAAGLGCAVHILGDLLTTQGVPVLWPWKPAPAVETMLWKSNGFFAVPILGTAGSAREWVFVTAINLYLAWVGYEATAAWLPEIL